MKDPNVVLVVLDCVRLKNLFCGEGEFKARTPNLERLAREGVTYDHAVAPANWTVPSHASMLTGLYPHEHGVTSASQHLAPGVRTLAQDLSLRGYQTALFTEQSHLAQTSGLSAGYATIRSTHPPRPGSHREGDRPVAPRSTRLARSPILRELLNHAPVAGIPLAALVQFHRSRLKRSLSQPSLAEQAADWVSHRSPGRPYHLLANFVDAHEPYSIGPMLDGGLGLREMIALLPAWYVMTVPGVRRAISPAALERGYIAGIEAADRKLGTILQAVESGPAPDRTLVMVTSDHGQQFGEGGNFYHAGGVTDAVARVPLFVRAGWLPTPGRIEHAWTSVREVHDWSLGLDDLPTAVDRSGGKVPDGSEVQTHPVWCEGSPAWEVSSAFAEAPRQSLWNRRLVASYLGKEKWTLDVDSGRVWHSRFGVASIEEEVRSLGGIVAHDRSPSLFPEVSPRNVASGGAIPPGRHEPSGVGRTLTSWGY